ncbi:MAG: DUF4115 domain-containing protein [Gammaproteobacteria bacterium]
MTEDPDKSDIEGQQVEAFDPLPGDLLLGARRARGMSVAKVAESLNLDPSVIQALEENRFEAVGAPVFARGHLRKYARLLSLDPDDVIRAYDAMAAEPAPAKLELTEAVEKVRPPASGNKILWLLGGLAMVALGMVLWRILLNGDAPPSEIREEIVEAADPERRPIPPPTAVQVPEKAEPEAEPRPEAAAASAESAPAPAPQTSESEPATAAQAAARSATAAVPVRRELVFTFEEDSWLDVRDGEGRRLAYELGRRGTRRTITGQAPFEIFLGNWPGVTVTFDGGQVPVPEAARRGKTARFSVPGGAE